MWKVRQISVKVDLWFSLVLWFPAQRKFEWRMSARALNDIVVKDKQSRFFENNKFNLCGLLLAVVHGHRWFRTSVFCPGFNENGSLPEISSPLCYGGSTEEDYHRACQPFTPVCGSSLGAMHTRLS